jgi:hypothetical protein
LQSLSYLTRITFTRSQFEEGLLDRGKGENEDFTGTPYSLLKEVGRMANITLSDILFHCLLSNSREYVFIHSYISIIIILRVEMTGVEWPTENGAEGDPFMEDISPLLNDGLMDVAASYYYFIIQRVSNSNLVSLMPCQPEKYNSTQLKFKNFARMCNLHVFLKSFADLKFFSVSHISLQYETCSSNRLTFRLSSHTLCSSPFCS